jgi:DNA-binding LytR/AlgR family response regulator
MNCIIIDDEPYAQALIKEHVSAIPDVYILGVFFKPLEALKMIENTDVHIVFLDINMPGLNGLELAKLIPEHIRIIFTTAYAKYAVDSYAVNALDYLLKPISLEQVENAVSKAKAYLKLKEATVLDSDFLLVKSEYKQLKVSFNEIMYIQNIKDYVRFYLTNGNKIMSLMSLKSLEETLPKYQFMKVHRSYIVGRIHVQGIIKNKLIIQQYEIPVSERYKKEVRSLILMN